MNRKRLILFTSLIGIVFLACKLPGAVQQGLQTTAMITPVATQFPVEPTAMVEIPTQAPTADLLAESKACLMHTWEATDISQAVIAAIPTDMAQEYNLQYTGTTGKGTYTLTPDGDVIMQADQMELQFTAKASIFDVPLTVKVDGEARGKYSLDGNILTTTDMDTSGLTASAQALGQDVVEPGVVINAIPLINPTYNQAEYTCSGDTMTLRLLSYPDNVPPLVFKRVK